ncbi:MAG: helix-turn-helix domain-containing protein [Acidobacteria bacterium]|nr:helix-turn-helix domain-containing protein [Acidobacteriota bacterium]
MNAVEDPGGASHLGQVLRQARLARTLSREYLAEEVNLHPSQLQALEEGRWKAFPPGGVRPLVRQLADRLGVDLADHVEAFEALPGLPETPPVDPAQERMERWAVVGLSALCLLLLGWLVVPGPRLGQRTTTLSWLPEHPGTYVPPPPPPAQTAYPVLGDMLPEAPHTEAGMLVSLRAQDVADAILEGEGGLQLTRTLRVSEPWKLRVKGAFRLRLSNAGVVRVEVAGEAIDHGAAVGEDWEGRFDAEGRWIKPKPKALPPGGAPEIEETPQ